MAKKKSTPAVPSDSEERYSDSSEENNFQTATKAQQIDEGNETESDTSGYSLKRPASISREKLLKSSSAIKRTADVRPNTEDIKRSKGDGIDLKAEKKQNDMKKQIFHRVWSEEDEVKLLECVHNFNETIGKEVKYDVFVFYDLIKKDVMSFDFTLNQLKDKLGRMRKKFKNWVQSDEKKNLSEHDKKIFELSKLLWKFEVGAGEEEEKTNTMKFMDLITDGFSEKEKLILKKGLQSSDNKKKKMLIEDLKILENQELQISLKRIEILKNCMKILLASKGGSKGGSD